MIQSNFRDRAIVYNYTRPIIACRSNFFFQNFEICFSEYRDCNIARLEKRFGILSRRNVPLFVSARRYLLFIVASADKVFEMNEKSSCTRQR